MAAKIAAPHLGKENMKLSESDAALLQARHAYNDAKIIEITEPTGFTMGSQDVIIKMNRMAFGLFEQTILKAFKERQDLRDRNPDLVEMDKECEACKGAGKFPFEGEELKKQIADWNEGMDPSDYFYLQPDAQIATPCRPCQNTGIVLKEPEPKADNA